MCVIAIYRNGARPTRDELQKMMGANGDGAGIGWNDGKRVFFKKGLDSVEAVEKLINRISPNARTLVFHARISTSGGISAEKCHPFLVSTKNKELDLVSYGGTRPVLFHNGVFHIDPEKGLNDTQTFIKTIFAPLINDAGSVPPYGALKGLFDMAISGSRIAVLTPTACLVYGEGWKVEGGNMYSNLNWKWWTERKELYKYGGGWDCYGRYGHAMRWTKDGWEEVDYD